MTPWSRDYTVRFGEIDYAGVMYYPALFDRIHRAFEDFWDDLTGRGYAGVLQQDGVGFPLIDVHARFRAPFRFGETLTVALWPVRIGGRSIAWRVELRGGDGVRADADLVTAVIGVADFRPKALPDALRVALERRIPPP